MCVFTQRTVMNFCNKCVCVYDMLHTASVKFRN